MAFGGGSKGVKNEINVTPLVDVVLVLLIIFMVITPMLQRGKDVHLPVAHNDEADKKQADPLVLSITQDRKIWIESNGVEEADLEGALQAELQKSPNRKILLKGDERLTVGDVRKVMAHANHAGAHAVALGIQEEKK
jgi:biopolymer transport protein TolR